MITLTGKETKADLIQLLCEGNAMYERLERNQPHYYRGDSKTELLRHVKVYNANIASGGNGNISTFFNDEAQSHKLEVDNRVRELLESIGVTSENMSQFIPQNVGLSLLKEWTEYLNKEHNGFIGHTAEEKEMAFIKQRDLFLSALPESIIKQLNHISLTNSPKTGGGDQ